MTVRETHVEIRSRDYWFKVVEFLQQNWALVDATNAGNECTVFFLGDTSGVFDRLYYSSAEEAEQALRRNGFSRLAEDKSAQGYLAAPKPPFRERPHPNGPIYSSGKFWR